MGRKILIVDDEVVLLKHLGRLFAREGYEVTTAATWTQALQHLERGPFDALLLDLKLPDGDGLGLLAGLTGNQRPPRAVLMTALSTPEHEAQARQLDVICLMRKPLDLAHLVHTVNGAASRP